MYMPSANAFTKAERIRIAAPGRAIVASHAMTGIAAGARVETPSGWQLIETVLPGTPLATWDGGFAPVASISHNAVFLGRGAGLLHVPGGALGNCQDMLLQPEQDVLLDAWAVEEVLGVGAVRVAAAALAGLRGITLRTPDRPITTVVLGFAEEEAVFVDTGALLHCRGAKSATADAGYFPAICAAQARALFELIDDGAPGWAMPTNIAPRLCVAA